MGFCAYARDGFGTAPLKGERDGDAPRISGRCRGKELLEKRLFLNPKTQGVPLSYPGLVPGAEHGAGKGEMEEWAGLLTPLQGCWPGV